MKTKLSLGFLFLACFIVGCDQKPAPPPTTAKPAPSAPTVAQPVAQTTGTPPSAPEVAISTQKSVQSVKIFDLGSLLNSIPTNRFVLSDEGGWDKFTMPKVQKWVNDNLIGKRVSNNVCLLQCNVNQE